jgi:hypothetical protein
MSAIPRAGGRPDDAQRGCWRRNWPRAKSAKSIGLRPAPSSRRADRLRGARWRRPPMGPLRTDSCYTDRCGLFACRAASVGSLVTGRIASATSDRASLARLAGSGRGGAWRVVQLQENKSERRTALRHVCRLFLFLLALQAILRPGNGFQAGRFNRPAARDAFT